MTKEPDRPTDRPTDDSDMCEQFWMVSTSNGVAVTPVKYCRRIRHYGEEEEGNVRGRRSLDNLVVVPRRLAAWHETLQFLSFLSL